MPADAVDRAGVRLLVAGGTGEHSALAGLLAADDAPDPPSPPPPPAADPEPAPARAAPDVPAAPTVDGGAAGEAPGGASSGPPSPARAEEGAAALRIVVRSVADGRCCVIPAASSDTIGALKERIAASPMSLAVEQQRLLRDGARLSDECTVEKCGLGLYATVYLLTPSTLHLASLCSARSSHGYLAPINYR
eukprot:TRINITY_DN70543_c0_g1_i1.p1 TRINITY_DN70543_c0_g1~~TRINITY_DN70543_c0_g1_i1.p1  ORF type:complete len:217 (+),score=56.19 TRINITY_DN70543_c0_g1_i1:76-651(+)